MRNRTAREVRQVGRQSLGGRFGRQAARVAVLALLACRGDRKAADRDTGSASGSGDVVDEAKKAGLTAKRFPEAPEDVFAGMDHGIRLSADEIKGRNTWMLWAGGNESFWDWLAMHGYGTTDLLRMLDSRKRGTRFAALGLVNDPNLARQDTPDSLGLYLDRVVAPEREHGIDPDVYGAPSGVVGLRLFPNPNFNAAARARWDAKRFYTDARYYNDRTLVRPYRVGMACAFCHVAPHPLNPPTDPENPKWENLSAAIGNQYFRTKNVFTYGSPDSSFVYQLLQANRDGTLDTSFLGTDQTYNPSNMNSLFELGSRLQMASAHRHELRGGARDLQGLKDSASMNVPLILKDGADNVGILGALSRVYINIGTFHEQWRLNQDILLGVRPQTPFPVAKANANSVYWQVTEHRVNNLAKYFLRVTSTTADTATRYAAMRLEDAPGGAAYLTKDTALLNRGKVAFATECAACHSSKRPPAGVDPRSAQGQAFFRQSVMAPDFRTGNYLSTDERIPLHVVKTNACRAVAMNATRGHVWDNFSSETYKTAPASQPVQVYNPWTKDSAAWQPPGGGRGYYRVPTLVSLWSSAPFLHNNELGIDSHDPSVAGRMRAFDDAVQKLLWPERRRGIGSIERTTKDSYLIIPKSYLPPVLQQLVARDSTDLQIGPIPAGTPVGLLASADLQLKGLGRDGAEHAQRILGILRELKLATWEIKLKRLKGDAAVAVLRQRVVPRLLEISNCPDFVTDRGHYFGTDLPDAEKRALIEYLKTL